MYAWIWHKLPGRLPAKLLLAVLLVALALWGLFGFVFPWLDELLGFGGTLWT